MGGSSIGTCISMLLIKEPVGHEHSESVSISV